MNRKLVNIILLLIFLVSLLPFSVNAAPRIIEAGLRPIEDFFTGGWQNYEKTVAFLVFFFLFFPAYLIGMKKAMGELTRAHKTFAFVAAFLSAFIISVSMRFDWVNLEYIAWFLIGVLILFGIYTLLCKLGLEKHKFWAFLLALLLTALLLWLIWYLMSEGMPLQRAGRVSNWFRGLGARARGVMEEEGEPKKELWPGGVVPESKEKRGMAWWLWALIIGIGFIVGVGGTYFGVRRFRRRREGPGRHEEIDPLQRLIGRLNRLLKNKNQIQESVAKLEKDKKKLGGDVDFINEKTKKIGGLKKFIEEVLPRLKDRSSDEHEELEKEYQSLKILYNLNLRIKHLFKNLLLIENYIVSNLNVIENYIRASPDNEKVEKAIGSLNELGEVSLQIHSKIQGYFRLEEKEELDEEKIRNLLSKENIEKIIKGEVETEENLIQILDREFKKYKEIDHLIKKEKKLLNKIIKILKGEEERKEGKVKPSKGPPVKGGINPVKVPRFARTESDMIGSAVSTKPKKWGISKEILDETYQEVESRINKIKNKGLNIDGIRIEDSRLPGGQNKYVPRRLKGINPYIGKNIFEVKRHIDKVYGPLSLHWGDNVERVKERIKIVKQFAKEDSVFKKKYYKKNDLFISPGDASRLYEDIEDNQKDAEIIDQMKRLDKAWWAWWDMFVLGVWQTNRLISAINRVVQKQGAAKSGVPPSGSEPIRVEVRREEST